MIKANTIHAVIAFWLFAFSVAAFAQQPATVGDLLDRGGKKLTKDELTTVLTGATVKGTVPSNPGRQSEMTYNKDGTATGRSSGGSGVGSAYGLFGTWLINDQGQLCNRLRNMWEDRSPPCMFYFMLGDTYYATTSDDKSAPVFIREIKH